MEENKVCVILGPTATRKTNLSVWLAKKIGGEIISADSMQIYKDMNIATAKIKEEEKKNIKHNMLDFLDIDKEFSVAQYVEIAKDIIYKIIKNKKKPIIVGGTGLYIDCLLSGINFKKNLNDNSLRERLQKDFEINGKDYIFQKLKELDPEYAKNIHKNNIKRIIRAIEILTLTKKNIKENLKENNKTKSEFKSLKIGLNFKNRDNLYDNINKRVDIMVEEGLFEEAKKILSMNPSKTAMQAIGYKEIKQYFENKMSFEETILKIKQNSRKYAKRQFTWFRRDENINWFFWDEDEENLIKNKILKSVENFFKEN